MVNAVHTRILISICILTVFLRHGVSKLSGVNRDIRKKNELSIEAEELLRRRKIVNLYLSEDTDTKEKWIETHHLNLKASEHENLNSASDKTELDTSLTPTLFADTKFLRHGVSKLSGVNRDVSKKDELSIDSEELNRRRKIVDLYLSEDTDTKEKWRETYHLNFEAGEHENLNSASDKTELDTSLTPTSVVDTKEEWIETYHLNFEGSKPESLNKPKLSSVSDKTELDGNLKPTFSDIRGKVIENKSSTSEQRVKTCKESMNIEYIRDRLYFIRWIKKLLSKFDNHYNDYNSITISLSSDSLKGLKEILSLESFDIVKADEIIFNLISNATTKDSWNDFLPSNQNILMSVVIVLTTLMFFYCCMNRPVYAIGLLICFTCIWHSVNMHQKIMAQKHATLSRISPAYCVNTLTENSGVFEHMKQYILNYVYAEDCKKYYDALMVDPTSEINMLNVIVNFAATAVLQIFQVLGPVLNSFIKDVLYNTDITQKIFVIFIFFFMFCILLLFFKYKIKLPFWLGSFEPVIPVGSQAQDLKFSTQENLSIKKCQNVDTATLNSPKENKVSSSQDTVYDLKDNMSCSTLISSKLQPVQQDDMNYEACSEIEDVKPFNLLDEGKEICAPRDDANEISVSVKKILCTDKSLSLEIKVENS